MWHRPQVVRTVAVAFSALAPVAQLDRADGFYPSGCTFESCRGRQSRWREVRLPPRHRPPESVGAPFPFVHPLTYSGAIDFRGSTLRRRGLRPTEGCSTGGVVRRRACAPGCRPYPPAYAPSVYPWPWPSWPWWAWSVFPVLRPWVPAFRRPPHAWSGSSFTETWTTGNLPDVGGPVALSSPIPVTLGGQASVVVGDRTGDLFAYHLGGSSPGGRAGVAGYQRERSHRLDPFGLCLAQARPRCWWARVTTVILYRGATRPTPRRGSQQWFTQVVNPPSDTSPVGGVQAGIAVGSLQSGGLDTVAGSRRQVYLRPRCRHGCPADRMAVPQLGQAPTPPRPWPTCTAPAGAGSSTEGTRRPGWPLASSTPTGAMCGYSVPQGNQICRADTNQVVDSSPAIGRRLPGGATGIVVGTGGFFADASDSNTFKAYNNRCQLQWSSTLDGDTFSSPALSDVLGNGALQVVEGGRPRRLRGLGLGPQRRYRPEDLGGQGHQPGHRLGGHRRSDRPATRTSSCPRSRAP